MTNGRTVIYGHEHTCGSRVRPLWRKMTEALNGDKTRVVEWIQMSLTAATLLTLVIITLAGGFATSEKQIADTLAQVTQQLADLRTKAALADSRISDLQAFRDQSIATQANLTSQISSINTAVTRISTQLEGIETAITKQQPHR